MVAWGGKGAEGSKGAADVDESCDESCVEAMGVIRGRQEAIAGAVGEGGEALEASRALQSLGVLV